MANLQDALDSKKGDSTPLLSGSKLPRKMATVALQVTGCRQAPENFNSPALMDFEPVTIDGVEYCAIPLNKTNAKVLMEHVGNTALEDIRGKATFQKVLVNNPQTMKLTPGLQLIEFKLSKGGKKKAPKAGPASRRGGKPKDDEDVPF